MRYLNLLLLAFSGLHCARNAQPGDILSQLAPPRQHFAVRIGQDTTLVADGGSRIRIRANSLQTGAQIITIEVIEALDRAAMIRAGLSTLDTEGRLLESQGMIYFNAVGPAIVRINPEAPIEISLPARSLAPGVALFSGEDSEHGTIVWRPVAGEVSPFVNAAVLDTLAEGKALYREHCTGCHCLSGPLTGPALGHIGRYRDRRWLRDFTRSSQKMIESGDSLARCLWEKWKPSVMQDFPQLSDGQIDAIYAYIAAESVALELIPDAEKFGCVPSAPLPTEAPAHASSDTFVPGAPPKRDRHERNRQKMDEYVFLTRGFGWLNCDRYLDETTPASLRIEIADWSRFEDISVWLVYENRRITMPLMQANGVFMWDGPLLPGHAQLLALALKGKKWFMAEPGVEIGPDNRFTLTMQPLSRQQVDEAFKKLEAPPAPVSEPCVNGR